MRKAWYAGTWYAAEPDSLRETIEHAIDQVKKDDSASNQRGAIRFAVLPHAGLAYSARGIAHLVVHAPPTIERVLIISPSHTTVLPENTLSFGRFSGYETPLGTLQSFSTTLESEGPDVSHAIQREHAVEMVLPFLSFLQQKQESPIHVSMALISQVTEAAHAMRLAQSIVGALGEEELETGRTLVLSSSDFTHYGQRFGYAPFGVHVDDKVAQKVKKEDLVVANQLSRCELGPIFLSQRMRKTTICGIGGATIVSGLAKYLDTVGWVADYYSSRDVLGSEATDFVAYGTVLWR